MHGTGAPGSVLENRIISLLVFCGPAYPDEMPEVHFQSKLNFPFVVRREARVEAPPRGDSARGRPRLTPGEREGEQRGLGSGAEKIVPPRERGLGSGAEKIVPPQERGLGSGAEKIVPPRE